MRSILRRFTRPIWNLFGYDAEFWRGPMLAGALLAAVTWIIWYYTKVPCTAALAADGLCNPGALANYINVDIASRCTAAWLGTTTLTGGINAVMLERERQRTEEARQRADEARQELAEHRRLYDARIQELINENRAERQQSAAERQQSRRRAPAIRRYPADDAGHHGRDVSHHGRAAPAQRHIRVRRIALTYLAPQRG